MDRQRIVKKQLNQAFIEKSWHGTNLRGSLRGLKLETVLYRPSADRHNIWEHVLHCAYWKYVVRRRITGSKKGGFAREGADWPSCRSETEKEWKEDIQLLIEEHRKLLSLVDDLEDDQWSEFPGDGKFSVEDLLIGVASHDLYHCGQIQLLKRLAKK